MPRGISKASQAAVTTAALRALWFGPESRESAILCPIVPNSLAISDSFNMLSNLWRHRYLIGQLVRRDVLLKYRGSYLGIGWSFFYPLLLLGTFTLVFGQVFGSRWPQPEQGEAPLALAIYCGLVIFTPFSEIASAAPRLILGYQNYVKKIIFPTEILPVMLVLSASVHALINLGLLILALAYFAKLHPTLLLLPLVLLPAFLFALGIAWLLAAAGVFVRDLVHVMPVFMQILMFVSPVFYPASVAPESLRWIYLANPLGRLIEDLRRVTLGGEILNWETWLATLGAGLAMALLGYAFFQRGKEEFADVL